jgi:hypothetical protein
LRHPFAPIYAALVLHIAACRSDSTASVEALDPEGQAGDAAPGDVDASRDGADEAPDAQAENPTASCENPPRPLLEPGLLPVCPGCAGAARCVPRQLIAERAPDMVERLAACNDQAVCLPDPVITSMGFYAPETCRSLNEAEGRCLSECLPAVASQRDILPQAGCGEFERCVPCFDPLSGEPSGACEMPCDPGPREPEPRLFPRCCEEAGLCVPSALVPAEMRGLLGRDGCESEDALCAPEALTEADARPVTCSSLAGAEGRCLAACLPPIAERADELPQSACATGEVCAPCFDPFTGEETSACRVRGDAPTQSPVLFATCCGGLGACVPPALVDGQEAAMLSADSCAGAGELCVPRAFTDRAYVPPSCRSIGDAEGRCLPACLLEGLAQGASLPQATCQSGELCAPCYNPQDGAPTGACALRGDAPREPPVRFDTACCGQSGLCIPGELAGSGADMLPADRCASEHGSGWLCAPKSVLADPSRRSDPFESCRMNFGLFRAGRGKCVPQCMIDAKGWVKRLLQRSSCASGELCVLCSLGGVPGC